MLCFAGKRLLDQTSQSTEPIKQENEEKAESYDVLALYKKLVLREQQLIAYEANVYEGKRQITWSVAATNIGHSEGRPMQSLFKLAEIHGGDIAHWQSNCGGWAIEISIH